MWVVEQVAAEHEEIAEGYVGGASTPGMGDLALASLAAPLVLPEAFCEGRFAKWFEMLLEQDAALRGEVDEWRQTSVGRHCLRLYARRRQPLV